MQVKFSYIRYLVLMWSVFACTNIHCDNSISTKAHSSSSDLKSNKASMSDHAANRKHADERACPANYLLIKANKEVGALSDFCVMKFEAKNVKGKAITQAANKPWVSIAQLEAVAACKANGLGFDLISNEQWQAMAREIEGNSSNWSKDRLNRGHSDRDPFNPLAGHSEDNKSCAGTGQSCSLNEWNSQRRTHRLASDQVIWDVAGNVWEWTKGIAPDNAGGGARIEAQSGINKIRYGPAKLYSKPSGLGHLWGSKWQSGNGVIRGGGWSRKTNTGIFSTHLAYQPSTTNIRIGFRCVFLL